MREFDHDQAPEAALAWCREGKGAALATVTQTWGSAPRPVGAMLAISGRAEMLGSVSGGCVEGAVVEEALAAIGDGEPRSLRFGVTSEEAFAVGLACGGEIRVHVDPVGVGSGIAESTLANLVERRAAREGISLAIPEGDAPRRLVRPGDPDPLASAAADALRSDRSVHAEADGLRWFLSVHNPPLRLAVVGASHIAQPLVGMASLAGYDVTVIDPRDAFASEARFPGMRIRRDWPDAALKEHGLDARVAVVTLSHDPKIDDPAIVETLASEAFYLGCLGSARTHSKRLARLRDAGLDAPDVERIHAPIGLDIGAKSPAEIAVAILAEITDRLRRGGRRLDAAP